VNSETRKKSDKENLADDFEYPLRDKWDILKFGLYLFVLPILITAAVTSICGYFLFPDISARHFRNVAGVHSAILLLLLILLWIPVFFAIVNWKNWIERTIILVRNVLGISFILFFFPHKVVYEFLAGKHPEINIWNRYWAVVLGFSIIYLVFAALKTYRTAFKEIMAGEKPQERKHPERLQWFDSMSFIFLLCAVIVIELWTLSTIGNNHIEFNPCQNPVHTFLQREMPPDSSRQTDSTRITANQSLTTNQSADSVNVVSSQSSPQATESPGVQANANITISNATQSQATNTSDPDKKSPEQIKREMRVITWLACSILTGLIFFLSACLGNRLVNNILVPVTFHERDVRGVVQKAYRYLWHFSLAMLLKHPFLLIGGILISFIFLSVPIILISIDQHSILNSLVQIDLLILVIVISFAWFSPMTLAVVRPDETFGEYFNQRLANHLMMVQGHIVLFGFGSLGKRVLNREISKMLNHKEEKKSRFLEVVTPDVRLEQLSNHVVVIEKSPADVIYSGMDNLLGSYGVVSTYNRIYKSKDPRGEIIHPEKRILVPTVIGMAKEPFISSRVNLERARLIISMVPDEESVQTIFDRANQSNVPSIISVSRSDQISYLTYRARHRRIVLVYPKHIQGVTLGNRLWAGILKVRSIEGMKGDEWPRVLVVGNSKSNHFMMEMLWTYLPGNREKKSDLIRKNFAFIVISSGELLGYPALKDKSNQAIFDMYWPKTFVTGGRFPEQVDQIKRVDELKLDTRMVNEADTMAYETCIRTLKPLLLVINHDEVEKSPLILLRCMRAIERLKMQDIKNFRLPLILLSSARGDEHESLVMGDSSRYYDALCKIHHEPLAEDNSYPQHSRYDHYNRELIGESISDSLSDAEEIIAGARRSFSGRGGKQFIEITGCLPNRPGSLANYLATLAGLKFVKKEWQDAKEAWAETIEQAKSIQPHLPSFQYLRHIKLDDPQQHGFALTGYAALIPIAENSFVFREPPEKSNQVARVFANDGRNYVEKMLDPDETFTIAEKNDLLKKLERIPEPRAPGVPDVINRLTRRTDRNKRNTVEEFKEVMMNLQEDGTTGKYACPGMNLCRIAAFQDYVAASNNLRLAMQSPPGAEKPDELWHAKNYYCCKEIDNTKDEEKPTLASSYARVFLCSSGLSIPGMIARVMNSLFFKLDHTRLEATGNPEDDWIMNIDYFQHITCQNTYFTMNRLFGILEDKPTPEEAKKPLVFPLHLVRIMPIGNIESAKHWFIYARTLYHILNKHSGEKFRFYWLDGNRIPRLEVDDIPTFDKSEQVKRKKCANSAGCRKKNSIAINSAPGYDDV